MAKTTVVQLTDDIDGSEGVEEVTFAVRGVEYEIDLGSKNLAAFDKSIEKWIDAARRVSRGRNTRPTARRAATSARGDLGAVREWARNNGFEVSDRGRISTAIREAYESATS